MEDKTTLVLALASEPGLSRINKQNNNTETRIVNNKCRLTTRKSQATTYKIGISKRINGERTGRILCDGNISELYHWLGSKR